MSLTITAGIIASISSYFHVPRLACAEATGLQRKRKRISTTRHSLKSQAMYSFDSGQQLGMISDISNRVTPCEINTVFDGNKLQPDQQLRTRLMSRKGRRISDAQKRRKKTRWLSVSPPSLSIMLERWSTDSKAPYLAGCC